jgi:hypothetical protein
LKIDIILHSFAVCVMLDVVARRRLRAGRSQINQACCIAKQKRVEFEILLLEFAESNHQLLISNANKAATRERQRDRTSNGPNGRRTQPRQHHSRRERGALFSEDELSALVNAMERAHSPEARQAIQARLTRMMHEQQLIQDNSDELRYRAIRRAERRERDRQRPTQDWTEGSITRGHERSENAEESEEPDEHDDSEGETLKLLELVSLEDDNSAFASLSDRQLHRLARRAEEETELNRAILMSLQFSNSSNESAPTDNSTAVTNTNANINAESIANASNSTIRTMTDYQENISTLMSMGFERSHCEQVLRETHNNMELAAHILLGVDF